MSDEVFPMTINFTARSVAAMQQALDRGDDTATDIHNRAVQVYNYLDEVWRGGGEVFFRRSPDGEVEKLNVW